MSDGMFRKLLESLRQVKEEEIDRPWYYVQQDISRSWSGKVERGTMAVSDILGGLAERYPDYADEIESGGDFDFDIEEGYVFRKGDVIYEGSPDIVFAASTNQQKAEAEFRKGTVGESKTQKKDKMRKMRKMGGDGKGQMKGMKK